MYGVSEFEVIDSMEDAGEDILEEEQSKEDDKDDKKGSYWECSKC